MKLSKFVAICLLVFSAQVFAASAPGKVTYSQEQLATASVSSLPDLLQRFVIDTGRVSLIQPDKVLVLIDGKPEAVESGTLPKYKSVEVISDNDAIVVNFRTKA